MDFVIGILVGNIFEKWSLLIKGCESGFWDW